MKSFFTVFFLTLFSISAFSLEKDYNVTIKVKGMENQMGILAYYYGDKRFVKDTLYFNEKGTAAIKGKKDIAKGVYLIAFPSIGYRTFDLILNETNFTISTDTSDFVLNGVVKNSIENEQLFSDMKYMQPLGVENDKMQKLIRTLQPTDSLHAITEKSLDSISNQITAHRKEMLKKNPNTFYSKLIKIMMDTDIPEGERKPDGSLVDTFYAFHYLQQHYFDAIDFSDSGYIRSPVFQGKLLRYFDSYVHPQPDSINKAIDALMNKAVANNEMYQYCLNELFTKYAKSEIMGYDAIYVHIADNYYLNGKVWWSSEKGITELKDRVDALRPTLIGKIAPNFVVQDSTGKNQFIHDFIPKHDFTVLVFWNSDCSHCQHEIPELKRIYNDSLKSFNVGVMAVSTEQTDSSFRAFAAKNCASDWLTCADMRGVSAFRRGYDVIATPKVFLIYKDYKIVAKNLPVNKLVDVIQFERNKRKEEH